MTRPAPTDHAILPVLSNRWSPRAFSERLVSKSDLTRLFEAARWAASSYNEQPWRFLVATKDHPKSYQKILTSLLEANQAWAQQAPVLGLTVTSTLFIKNGKPNRCHEHDLGLAMGNLCAEATGLGLVVHQMAGVELEHVAKEFNVPENYRPFSAFAIGYEGEADSLPQDWMVQAEISPRTRLPLAEFVFTDSFGKASPLVG